MKYDFTSILDRHGKDAIAVDAIGSGEGWLPEHQREGFDAIPDVGRGYEFSNGSDRTGGDH